MFLLPLLHFGWQVAGHSREIQSSKLGSWSARLLCRMVSCRRRPDETPVEHWCRRHRKGHALAESFGLDLPQQCLLQKHRLAGYLARSAPNSLADSTLTARDLEWWRHAQAAHAKLKDKWSGAHRQPSTAVCAANPAQQSPAKVGCSRRKPVWRGRETNGSSQRKKTELPVYCWCQPPSWAVYKYGAPDSKM